MRKVVPVLVLAAVLFAAVGGAQESVGRVKNIDGKATVNRQGVRQELAPGDLLFEGDVLKTGVDSALGLLLGDDSRLSVGAETTFVIKRYLFQPEADRGSLLTRLVQGSLLCVSGLIAKMSPDAAQVETPDGTLGIRGTKFLVVVEAAK